MRCSLLGEEQDPRYRVTLAHHTAERHGERAINPSLCDPSRLNRVHPVPRDMQCAMLPEYIDSLCSKGWISNIKQIKFDDFFLTSNSMIMIFVLPVRVTLVDNFQLQVSPSVITSYY